MALKNSNVVKNQHYIPEGLLSFFTNEKGQIFEILLSKSKIYPTSPSNSMSETFVYEHEALEKNELENQFAKLDNEAINEMAELLSVISDVKNGAKEFADIKKCLTKMLPKLLVFYYRSGALLTEFASGNSDHKIPLLTKKILNIEYIQSLSKILENFYNCGIIESSDDFLMSDQFISTVATGIKSRFFDVSNRHIGLTETLVLIPVNASFYVAYWNSAKLNFIAEKINLLSENELINVNRSIINNSYIKSIAKKQERVEQAHKDFRFSSPTQIYAGGNPNGYTTGAIKKKEVFYDPIDKEAFDMLELMNFSQYKGLGRNDLCGCKSGKKFKKCHENPYSRIKFVIQNFGNKNIDYAIPNIPHIELPIDSWAGFKKD